MADEEFPNRSTGKCLQAVKPELESSDSAGDGPALPLILFSSAFLLSDLL